MKYKAICFDVDGTLYSADILHRTMAPFIFLHPNLNRKYNKMRRTFRKYQDGFDSGNLKDASMREREIAMMMKAWDISEKKATRIVLKGYYPNLKRTYRKLGRQEETVATLKALKEKGYKIGVFSDWPLFDKLERLGVKDLVDFAACSDDTKLLKPNAHCFEYLMYNLKIKPSETLYVGDSYPKDIVGSSNANVDAVLLSYGKNGNYEKAKKVFDTWNDFSNWILTVEEKNE